MSAYDRCPSTTFPGIMGILGPFVALVSITIAILLSISWFTWDGNALSDLGNYDNGLPAAIVFNVGLVLTGILLLAFTICFVRTIADKPTKIGVIPFFIALVFLILIGILSENAGRIHYYVSVGFFLSFPFAMWFVGIGWLRFRRLWWFSLISILLPFFCLYMWLGWYGGIFPFWTGNAIPEITTAFTGIGWLWIIWMLYHKEKLPEITG
ncbi:MAG: DUF998 domain-containing protein [Candidatus Thorarchaeota archaeon]